MMIIHYLFLILGITSVFAIEYDVNTFSNYLQVQNKHLHLEWLLNLEQQYINATSEYEFHFLQNNVQQISLDIYELSIHVVYLSNGEILKHFIDSPYKDSDQGQRLNIVLNRVYKQSDIAYIRIKYSIDTRSRSLSFMTPEQTSTGTLPYLFSQCEDANCRALAPLQDTPAIKQTYTASILWDGEYDVFMSADESTTEFPLLNQYTQTLKLKQFTQKVPIPSYLIAIVAGNIKKQATGTLPNPRTFVISETDKIDQYATELTNMEEFLQALEAYIGPYTWGTYTIVIQPPSFPIGGMENPLLTFANPTIMTGTGSGLAVAIHEMAHSWFGNTITCVNWSNMWINEGFTVFLERKGSLNYYKNIDLIKIDATSGNTAMIGNMEEYGMTSSYSSLHPDTTGINPDDTFSEIPYEKGFQLLTYLESVVGQDDFQKMLKSYLAQYKYQSIGEGEFKAFLLKYLTDAKVPDLTNKTKKILDIWHQWVYVPGLPPIQLDFSTPLIDNANALAEDYIVKDGAQPGKYQEYSTYLSNQKRIFLEYFIAQNARLNPAILNRIDEDLKLTNDHDQELRFRWFTACLLAKDRTRFTIIGDFLGSVGRGKMIYPVYKTLYALDAAYARQVFATHEKFYHPIAQKNVRDIVYPKTQQQ